MQRIKFALIIFFTLALASCTHKQQKLFLETNPQNIISHSNSNLNHLEQDDVEIFYSSFAAANEANAKLLKDRRKKLFEYLFVDEKDPYSSFVRKRSACLLNVEPDGIKFFSGPNSQWSDCDLIKTKVRSNRSWVICASTLWEITIKLKNRAEFPKIRCP